MKKYLWLIFYFVFLVILCIALIYFSRENIDFWVNLYDNNDFHYNLITFNSVIAGFLFSGISILISLISNSSVKRLWDCGYLDSLYVSGGVGIIMSILSIVMSFVTVLKFDAFYKDLNFIFIWTVIEIICAIGSLFLFMYCVKELMFSIRVIRKNNK